MVMEVMIEEIEMEKLIEIKDLTKIFSIRTLFF